MTILVFGSIGADLVSTVKEFPREGQMVPALSFEQFAGGKGSNQALAAKRAGSEVLMAGAVGDDEFSKIALKNLIFSGVNISLVQRTSQSTGIATIFVDQRGQNCISVYPGANGLAAQENIPDSVLSSAHYLVMQHECSLVENKLLSKRARELGVQVVLNAAPAYPLYLDDLENIDILIVNETEAEFLATQHNYNQTDDFCYQTYLKFGCKTILTLGEKGAQYYDGLSAGRLSAPLVNVVDTTGAGDSFVGAFVSGLDHGCSFSESIKWGIAAGSLSCTKKGAQSGVASKQEILNLAATLF